MRRPQRPQIPMPCSNTLWPRSKSWRLKPLRAATLGSIPAGHSRADPGQLVLFGTGSEDGAVNLRKVRFAVDALLEGDGFELVVPEIQQGISDRPSASFR